MQPDTSTYIPYYWVLNGTCANSDKEGLESKEQAIQTGVISASVTSLIKVGANRTHFCEEIQRNDSHNTWYIMTNRDMASTGDVSDIR